MNQTNRAEPSHSFRKKPPNPPSTSPMASPSSSSNLHFILFPLMAQGHMIPMVDIARLLAQHNVHVTVITTPVNANRFKSVTSRAIKSNLKFQVVELKLPLSQFGLPEGCESFDSIPSLAQVDDFCNAIAMLEKPAETMLRSLTPPPSCIISDSWFPWTTSLANRLNIPRIIFYGPGCFTYLCIHIVVNTNILDEIKSDNEYFVLPGLPDRILVTKPQASDWPKPDSKNQFERFQRTEEAGKGAFGIVVNSFEELEPKYVEEFAKAKNKKVWCIGPVSLCNTSFEDIAERGSKVANTINEHGCLKWLDSREQGSVVYICLGSLSYASTEQLIELGLGLELSNKPFIWFIRETSEELERWILEEGFEERVKDRGLIVFGWAPQILILPHRAIGGFVTHCGWNSTLEGISSGIPMVTWPHFSDQFLNERFIVDVLRIGVKIGVEAPISFGERDKLNVMVKREDVKTAVEGLMNDDEEGEARRKRARELGEMAKRAMEEGGSSHLNILSMIQAVADELANNSKPLQGM